ncbi:MAG: hypothetical protein JXR51_01955 [Bacteroidales bacterium]|nr:hypothetical protein [Bacteroidales bacterium]MBN2755910.1 hypothetical protein [Bacteroidales bacterium]
MKKEIFSILFILFLFSGFINAQSVVNSLHNLSLSGAGTVIATSESEVCIFCHTTHSTNPIGPLWNRNDPGSTYILYDNSISNTFQSTPGQPDGSSVLCLSCHDGTIALGNVISRSAEINLAGSYSTMQGINNLTTDLSDDHPVSFVYNSTISATDGQLIFPPTYPVKLDNNSKLQCTSCHDPHSNNYQKMLVSSNQFSELCFRCHDRNYWSGSSHQSSTASWNGNGINPWEHIESPYPSVAENACQNCHNPHSANGKARLMKSEFEENNCLDCHNGNVASKNIEIEMNKSYRHNVFVYNNLHDPLENTNPTIAHVECEDCHNPHAANNTTANAPYANGFLAGVKGMDQSGNAVNTIQYENELCYRCHADNPVEVSIIPRNTIQSNTRLEFDLSNPSYHPVVGPGKNTDVPGLISPLTESSVIYCTDCHSSDGSDSPKGLHGSIYSNILKYNYSTEDYTPESPEAYELCYSCHERTTILSAESSGVHYHINGKNTPCRICHDPHGATGSSLINFATDVVTPRLGVIQFVDLGDNSGYCLLICHGRSHATGMRY